MIKVDGNEREAYIESGRLSTICFVKSIAKRRPKTFRPLTPITAMIMSTLKLKLLTIFIKQLKHCVYHVRMQFLPR